MQRAIVLALIVAAVWVGITVYQEGVDHAFGGIFARAIEEGTREPSHALHAMKRVNQQSEARANRALGDSGFRDEE